MREQKKKKKYFAPVSPQAPNKEARPSPYTSVPNKGSFVISTSKNVITKVTSSFGFLLIGTKYVLSLSKIFFGKKSQEAAIVGGGRGAPSFHYFPLS